MARRLHAYLYDTFKVPIIERSGHGMPWDITVALMDAELEDLEGECIPSFATLLLGGVKSKPTAIGAFHRAWATTSSIAVTEESLQISFRLSCSEAHVHARTVQIFILPSYNV